MSKKEPKIIKTQITTSVGMSIQVDGDWVKTGHEISVTTTSYPTDDMYSAIAKKQLSDSIKSCGEQIDLLAKKVSG